MNLAEPVTALQVEIQAIRRRIHEHPELRFEERLTSDLVAKKLTEWGIEHERGYAKTAVVGKIRKGTGRKMIGLRGDMDALPLQELNSFGHASKVPGKMHACGHDGHTAMLLGAAKYLKEQVDFDGTVILIFQPAEEGGGGAREMIAEGFLERYPLDAAFAIHNWPGYALGTFALAPGPVMASNNELKIVVEGKGTHAGMPHLGVDPVPAACEIVLAAQAIVSREIKARDAAVLSITRIIAADGVNVVPNQVLIEASVRTYSEEITDLIEQRVGEIANGVAGAHRCKASYEFRRLYPTTVNDSAQTELTRKALVATVGEKAVVPFEPVTTSEDFSFFLQKVPGCYFIIGNGDGDHREIGHGAGPCVLHNGNYDFNDRAIGYGISAWANLTKLWFASN